LIRLISFLFGLVFLFAPAYAGEDVDIDLTPGRYLPGSDIAYAGLSISMQEGWHVYWRSPGEGGLAPAFKITSAKNLATMEIEWPMPKEYETSGAISFGYNGDVTLPLKLKPATFDQPIFLELDLSLYGCSNVCVPFRKHLSVMVTAEENTALSDLTDRWLASVPTHSGQSPVSAKLSGNGSALTVDLSSTAWKTGSTPVLDLGLDFAAKLISIDNGSFAHFEIRNVNNKSLTGSDAALLMVETDDGAARSYGLSLVVSASDGYFSMTLLIALAAGLILNVMPCVLPVLAIKLAGFTKDHVERRQGFLWTGIGIVASFAALAAGILALKAAGQAIGWGIQFQSPLFLGVMAVITMAFAVAMLDGFMIRLPYRFTARFVEFGKGSGRLASFFQGLVATLLATPCSAPLVGTAVGFAFTAGALEMMSIFLAMGVGMALPYFLIYVLPKSRRLLPKSGQWMGKLKVFLALGLVATSGTLLAYLAITSPYVAAALTIALTLFTCAILASKRLAALMVTVLLVLGVLSYPFDYGIALVKWQPFEPANIARSVSEGKTVVVDVTAAWCITCKVNETVAFSNSSVVSRLGQPDIIAMRADWTVENAAISKYLKSFGRYGIPFTVIYSKGHPDGQVLPEILTPGTLLQKL
jgi:suppressor for copper-sensitivity B